MSGAPAPKKQLAGQPRWMVWGAISALAAMFTMSLWTATMWRRAPEPGAAITEVTIPAGASLRGAAERLEQAGVIPSAELFEVLARTFGADRRDVQVGTYAFKEGEGWGAVLERLRRGDTVVQKVAIPEGMPAVLVAERLNATPRLTGQVTPPPEGSVLPATYEARVGEDRAKVLLRMQAAMHAELDRLWAARSDHTVARTPQEALALAAIVEKETADPSERRRIAGLYSNRLKKGMRLEADPTVIYPVTRGKPLGRRILRSELQADNGYNTYRINGLPVGPITNPGKASIMAVLDPEVHDYYYMVANGEGGHVFARSYDEHLANVARWRSIRQQRGI